MNSALETSSNCGIELPGDVGSAKDENAFRVPADAVHLYQKLCFDTAGGFAFAFAPRAAQRVDFIDEDDGGTVFSCHGEELFYQSNSSQLVPLSPLQTEMTYLSLSPIHLLTKSLLLTLKNVLLASVATALAK